MENNTPSDKTKNSPTENSFLTRSKFKLAIAILIFYLLFIAFLVLSVDTDEKYWIRLLFLFSGVEAIVFAAIGYVFGRDVGRTAEVNAKKREKETNKQKEKAEKDKNKAEKQAKADREQLIRIQEAVLSEKNFIFDHLKSNENIDFETTVAPESSFINFKSRAFELAKKSVENTSYTKVSLNYKIEIDNFKSITIDGEIKYTKEGYCSAVYAYGDIIEVEVDRDNFKTWKFTAFNIMDESGRSMKMSNSPLESNGNKSSFKIEY